MTIYYWFAQFIRSGSGWRFLDIAMQNFWTMQWIKAISLALLFIKATNICQIHLINNWFKSINRFFVRATIFKLLCLTTGLLCILLPQFAYSYMLHPLVIFTLYQTMPRKLSSLEALAFRLISVEKHNISFFTTYNYSWISLFWFELLMPFHFRYNQWWLICRIWRNFRWLIKGIRIDSLWANTNLFFVL